MCSSDLHVRGEVLASVPSLLPEAELLTDAAALERWLHDGGAVAVVDADSDDAVDAIARVLVGHEVVVVGPAGPIGAAFRAQFPTPVESALVPAIDGVRVVVSASASSIAREQVARVRASRPGVVVIESALPVGSLHADAARALSGEARDLLANAGLVVLVGGDTAAAVLGDGPRWVGGFAAPGMPWSLDEYRSGPVVVTKAGAFGAPDALVALLSRSFSLPSQGSGRDSSRNPEQIPPGSRGETDPAQKPGEKPGEEATARDGGGRYRGEGMRKPLAITMGDPSGVGPEIVLRRWCEGDLGDDVVVYGDLSVLRNGADLLGLQVDWDRFPVVDLGLLAVDDHRPGQLDARSGAAARAYVERATLDALAGTVAGIVTMPMNKEATQLSDPTFVGHTEFVAALCGADKVTMMLTADTLSGSIAVTHVSTHCSLADAIRRVTTDRVLDVVRLTHEALHRFIERPRIAVCGLNPHAGEHGLFGTEDIEHIAPAVAAAQAEGIDASGPHPADTVFFQAVHRNRYDAIVCMYHDQGHGPMKLLAFESGVNVTLGLPVVRTSVDHGTAFDIAWTGTAFTDSVQHAVAYARRLVSGSLS